MGGRLVILTPRLVESGPEVELYEVDDDTFDLVCRSCGVYPPRPINGFGVTASQGYALFSELYSTGWPHDCEGNQRESAASRQRDAQEALELEGNAA